MTRASLPSPHEPYVDKVTGKISEVWYRYLKKTSGSGVSKQLLTEGTIYYVATTGSDESGDGSTGNPWATPQHAYDWISENIDGGGNWVKIHLANGTYEMQTTTDTNIDTGQTEDAVMVIDRALTGVSALIVEGNSTAGAYFHGFGVLLNTGGFYRFRNIKFASPDINNMRGIFSRAPGAVIGILDGCEWGAFADTNSSTAGIHIYSQSIVKMFSPITISGGMHRFLFLEGAGSSGDWEDLSGGGGTPPWVVLTGTPAISYFIQVAGQGDLAMLNLTFSGTFTGTKYVRSGGSIGVFPYQHPNALIPGTIDGLELGPLNYGIDNNTGLIPAWTPDLKFGGSNTGITYNIRSAYYTEVGAMVFLHCSFNLSSKGAQVGAATIGGLPYTAGSYLATLSFTGTLQLQNITAPAATIGTLTCVIDPGATVIQLVNQPPAAAGTAAITDAEFNNNTSVGLSIMYFRKF